MQEGPLTVAEIARRLRLARQGVQRIADVLAREGTCVYRDNPHHRRAKLLALTAKGRRTLTRIEAAQRDWCDTLGERIGRKELEHTRASLAHILERLQPLC